MLLRMLTLVMGLLGAAALSQAPEFAQQYLQRLAGTADILTDEVAALDARASAQNMNRYDYIRRFLGNGDPAIRAEGMALSNLLARERDTREAIAALRDAPPLLMPWTAFSHLDPALAWRTLDDFRPALPLTAEGALHAGVGFLGLASLFRILVFLLRPRRRARQEPYLR